MLQITNTPQSWQMKGADKNSQTGDNRCSNNSVTRLLLTRSHGTAPFGHMQLTRSPATPSPPPPLLAIHNPGNCKGNVLEPAI